MPDTVALLPLDTASIVVPQPDTPEIVLKHIDGELIRVVEHDDRCFAIEAREEYTISWSRLTEEWPLESAAFEAADMQAFRFLRDGEPKNLEKCSTTSSTGETTLTIEPLDRGGIVLDRDRHLPVILLTEEGEYWLRKTAPSVIPRYVLECRETSVTNWETIEMAEEEFDLIDAVAMLSKHLEVEVVSRPSGDAIKEVLDGREMGNHTGIPVRNKDT